MRPLNDLSGLLEMARDLAASEDTHILSLLCTSLGAALVGAGLTRADGLPADLTDRSRATRYNSETGVSGGDREPAELQQLAAELLALFAGWEDWPAESRLAAEACGLGHIADYAGVPRPSI